MNYAYVTIKFDYIIVDSSDYQPHFKDNFSNVGLLCCL